VPVDAAPADSPRRRELLELTYAYVLERGVGGLSLRPLAAAIGTSPRVLLYLFGSKAGLVQALLARARAEELTLLARLEHEGAGRGLTALARELWTWLCAPEHRALLVLWIEGYSHGLVDPQGPWRGFGRATVEEWLELLARAPTRTGEGGQTDRTLLLAVLRGALLDLLATGDVERTSAAVRRCLDLMDAGSP
jgi:AcrR family transcriptional regulator